MASEIRFSKDICAFSLTPAMKYFVQTFNVGDCFDSLSAGVSTGCRNLQGVFSSVIPLLSPRRFLWGHLLLTVACAQHYFCNLQNILKSKKL